MGKDNIFCMNCGQKLPAEAKFCFACGQRVETGGYPDVVKSVPEDAPCQQMDMGGPAENDVKLTLAEFRAQAPSQTGFREQLLAYRKSLPHTWDYNAYVGILLGAAERSAARLTAQQNYAVGQGDNGKNATHTIETRGLTSVYEKYRGKNISPSILLSDVEEEIVSAVPDYAQIRKKFHEIVFAGTGEKGGAAELPHENAGSVAPVAEDIPHTEPVAAETEDASGIIDFFVEVLALRVLEYVTGDNNIDRADVKEKFLKWHGKLEDGQQEFEAYFGTSPEAKWLYSARNIVNRSIPIWEDRNIVDKSAWDNWFYREIYAIDEAVSQLKKLPEGKYGIAYYALARCYGVGIDTIIKHRGEKDYSVYVLRPNYAEMIRYLVKAAKAQNFEKEALLDLGCVELSACNYQNAKKIFEAAKKRGVQKAAIYLRYIECCEHAVPTVNGQRTTNDQKKQFIYGNIVEYKGRVYWMCDDRLHNDRDTIMLCSLGADGKRTVLAKMKIELQRFGGFNGFINLGSNGAAGEGWSFSICNDLIYYENGSGGICTMRLDGSDKRELTDLTDNRKTSVFMPMAFPGFLLYVDGGGQLWKRDPSGVKTKIRKLGSWRGIAGISEREVNIENRELIDLRTLERQKVEKKYPALKKKTVFYIDMAREIAYYEDNTDTGHSQDRRLIGVNPQGETVDYWEMPLMPYVPYDCNSNVPYDHISLYCYSSFCFNGQRLSVKIDAVEQAMEEKYRPLTSKPIEKYMELWTSQGLSEREWPHIALFDRRGNRRLLLEKKQGDWWVGSFHLMTENGVVILERHEGSAYWNTYYPVTSKGAIPPAKLDIFT